MGQNPDHNSQVSGEFEAGVPVPTDTPASQPAGRPGDPAPDLATLLKQAEDEASRLKDAWLRAMAETDNVRKLAQNDVDERWHVYEQMAAVERNDSGDRIAKSADPADNGGAAEEELP